jgi:hypothetical protein
MMWDEARKCATCDYPVTYYVISDAHDPEISCQFVYLRKKDGIPETGRWCPKCHGKLTLETTVKAEK